MPAVTMQTVTIPATFVCSTVKKPCERSIEIVDRLRCESVVEATVRMACYSERLSGFVAICMALHHESRFLLLSQEESRQRAERVRSKMLECLDLYRQQKECVPYKRAQRLIAAADPGCDNPAEAAFGLVWFCGPGVLRVVGCYWWCCAHWRAYWLGESQPSALWGCSSL